MHPPSSMTTGPSISLSWFCWLCMRIPDPNTNNEFATDCGALPIYELQIFFSVIQICSKTDWVLFFSLGLL